jgi:glycosyltransferase involved in cell wall biosynthesis
MIVAIDKHPLGSGHSYRGVGTYTRQLADSLRQHAPDITITWSDEADAYQVMHYPYFDLFFPTLPLFKVKPTVVTIHDVIPLLYPAAYPPGIKGALHYWRQSLSLRSVAAVITDSTCSKKDIVAHLPVPAEKVFVVPLAPAETINPISPSKSQETWARFDIDRPYFLYVGDINYNKNIEVLLRSFAAFSETHLLVMVCAALKGQSQEAVELNQLITHLNLTDKVIIAADIAAGDDVTLSALYSGADWYIQPSLYEGFGLPPLEAMKCRTAVISSTGGSLAEVVGTQAILFDPSDKEGLKNAIHQAVSLPKSEKQTLIGRAHDWVSHYSWQKTAQATAKIYREL